ncbi:MAG: hypothetical protein AAFS10_17835 [Myxococcota bacterium]
MATPPSFETAVMNSLRTITATLEDMQHDIRELKTDVAHIKKEVVELREGQQSIVRRLDEQERRLQKVIEEQGKFRGWSEWASESVYRLDKYATLGVERLDRLEARVTKLEQSST